jgi:heterodisulfide reductase subunit C2
MTTTASPPAMDPGLTAAISAEAPFDADLCMNCGVCTAVCPLGLSALPRQVLHLAALGLREKVLEHTEEIYSCLLCQMCEVNCPAEVHITGNIRALRHYLNHTEFGL